MFPIKMLQLNELNIEKLIAKRTCMQLINML